MADTTDKEFLDSLEVNFFKWSISHHAILSSFSLFLLLFTYFSGLYSPPSSPDILWLIRVVFRMRMWTHPMMMMRRTGGKRTRKKERETTKKMCFETFADSVSVKQI
jgi:hypothetical protein